MTKDDLPQTGILDSGPESGYSAESIVVLKGLEAVRVNPSLYVGSTDADGLHQLLFEVVDNAIDEYLAGFCTAITVILHEDGACSVEDNGRGIPVELHPVENVPACEVVLTQLYAGSKFKRGCYAFTTGLHGIGVSCVNALSEWLVLDVWRHGAHYRQRFSRGAVVSKLEHLEDVANTGTRISFLPDTLIFKDHVRFSYELLEKRLEELAFLNPGIVIHLDDRRRGETRVFQYSEGIRGFIRRLNESRTAVHQPPIYIEYAGEPFSMQVALQWTTSYGENLFSYVNGINTAYGGTHVNGLKTGLSKALNAYAGRLKLLETANGERLTTYDVFDGLTCVMALQMENPQFDSQIKKRLSNHDMQEQLDAAIYREFLHFLEHDSTLASPILDRVLEASRARVAARRATSRARYQSAQSVKISEEVYRKQFGIRAKNWHQSAAWITDQELLARHADQLKMDGDARALDVCCGSGVVGAAFRHKVGKITGLDITPQMIDLARQRLDEVQQGTVYNIPFPDNSFDLVVTREVLHILPQPEKPVSEIFRVLRPGGQFIVGQILPYGADDGPWMYRIFKKKQPLIFNMFQEDDFKHMLLQGGFIELEMTEHILWESIDVWINTHETSPLHRHEIRRLYYNAPAEARAVHPFEITPSGEIRDQWRWCIFSVRKPAS